MARMIPLFLAKDEENTSSMACQREFRDLNDPLECYDDLELIRRFRFSRASISQITELIAKYLNFTGLRNIYICDGESIRDVV